MSVSIHALKALYEDVIQDVIKSMKSEFDNEGVDDQVLGELEALWRSKLEESGVLSESTRDVPYYDQNYSMTYPHTQAQQATQYGNYGSLQQQPATTQNTYVPATGVTMDYTQLQQRVSVQQQYGPQGVVFAQTQSDSAMQHPMAAMQVGAQPANQRADGAKAGHMAPVQQQLQYSTAYPGQYYVAATGIQQQQPYYANIYQQYSKQTGQSDGLGEEEAEVQGLVEAENADRTGDSTARRRPGTEVAEIAQINGVSSIGRYGDLDAEELGSDLDEPDQEDGDEDPETDHLVLCQFDKVTRNKSKWKVTLKDGVMHLNNRDYVFHKATGEFDWA